MRDSVCCSLEAGRSLFFRVACKIGKFARGSEVRRSGGPGVGFGGPRASTSWKARGADPRAPAVRLFSRSFRAALAPRRRANPAGPRRGRRPQIASQPLSTDSLSAPQHLIIRKIYQLKSASPNTAIDSSFCSQHFHRWFNTLFCGHRKTMRYLLTLCPSRSIKPVFNLVVNLVQCEVTSTPTSQYLTQVTHFAIHRTKDINGLILTTMLNYFLALDINDVTYNQNSFSQLTKSTLLIGRNKRWFDNWHSYDVRSLIENGLIICLCLGMSNWN